MAKSDRVAEALEILKLVGLPKGQHNVRSALTLLALAEIPPSKAWKNAVRQQLGVTPIMEWISRNYGRKYAPNSRETFRRQTLHQFVQAGIALYNADQPSRPVNSPKAVYQLDSVFCELLKSYSTKKWKKQLAQYLTVRVKLAETYAKDRKLRMVPIRLPLGQIELSPGGHSELIRQVLNEFAARFVPGSIPVYVGDTGDKWAYFDQSLLSELGVKLDGHGKMPDVVLYWEEREWLVLVECVTSHGPVDPKRHAELERLFGSAKAGLVYVTAFPTRQQMGRYLVEIAWETEVWTAENPSHLIHFNGARFLGPYRST
jgi:hypothetical protein